jgi:hypothetical protein
VRLTAKVSGPQNAGPLDRWVRSAGLAPIAQIHAFGERARADFLTFGVLAHTT